MTTASLMLGLWGNITAQDYRVLVSIQHRLRQDTTTDPNASVEAPIADVFATLSPDAAVLWDTDMLPELVSSSCATDAEGNPVCPTPMYAEWLREFVLPATIKQMQAFMADMDADNAAQVLYLIQHAQRWMVDPSATDHLSVMGLYNYVGWQQTDNPALNFAYWFASLVHRLHLLSEPDPHSANMGRFHYTIGWLATGISPDQGQQWVMDLYRVIFRSTVQAVQIQDSRS